MGDLQIHWELAEPEYIGGSPFKIVRMTTKTPEPRSDPEKERQERDQRLKEQATW